MQNIDKKTLSLMGLAMRSQKQTNSKRYKFWLILASLIIIPLLASCATYKVETDEIEKLLGKRGKIPLKAALVVEPGFRESYEQMTNVKVRIGTWKAEGNLEVKYGDFAADLLKKCLGPLFQRLEVVSSRKVRGYQVYIVPKVDVDFYEIAYAIPPAQCRAMISLDFLKEDGSYINAVNSGGEHIGEARSDSGRNAVDALLTFLSPDSSEFLKSVGEDYCKVAMGRALISAVNDLLSKIAQDQTLWAYARELKERRERPCALAFRSPKFDDSNSFLPNKVLDAGEEAELIVFLKNEGNGIGFDVDVRVEPDNPLVKVMFPEVKLGDIAPGESKEIRIPIKADINIQDDTLSFLFEAKEKRGYDAKKKKLIIETARLVPPKLEIVSLDLNDSSGLGKGNGNLIPENNETIELIMLIKNRGRGKAFNVRVSFLSLTKNLEVVKEADKISIIDPGETAKASLAFHISHRFNAKKIDYKIEITDRIGAVSMAKAYSIPFKPTAPVLAYEWHILDEKGERVKSLKNGSKFSLEITPKNIGKNVAKGVKLKVSADKGISFYNSEEIIGEILPQREGKKASFSFSIPRTKNLDKARFSIKLSQENFPGKSDVLIVPFVFQKPILAETHQIVDQNRNGIIEQGESVTFILRVKNVGDLEARGVKVSLEIPKKYVEFKKDELVGTLLPSESKDIEFDFLVRMRTAVGKLPVKLIITQDDFAPLSRAFAYEIKEAKIEVAKAKGERKKLLPPPQSTLGYMRPNVVIAHPTEGALVYKDRVLLKGVASAIGKNKVISSIKVFVNGKECNVDIKKIGENEISFQGHIEPRIGKNVIDVVARDSQDLITKKRITVVREEKKPVKKVAILSDVDKPLKTKILNKNAIAVVIGNRDYQNPDVPSVEFAIHDAAVVRSYLIETLGYREADIIYEINATKATFERIFGIASNYQGQLYRLSLERPDSDVFIYYSGHGAPELNTKKAYFVPVDCDPNYVDLNGYPLEQLYKNLSQIRAKSITIVIDACFCGVSESGPILKDISPIQIEIESSLLRLKNAIVLTSSTGQQISSWYPEKKHGLFTYYFLKALKGEADKNKDKRLSVAEIFSYLKENVPYQARLLHNREQTPTLGGSGRDRIFVRY